MFLAQKVCDVRVFSAVQLFYAFYFLFKYVVRRLGQVCGVDDDLRTEIVKPYKVYNIICDQFDRKNVTTLRIHS